MPSNVAVEWPDTWVVEVDLHDEVAIGTNELGIAALRVGSVDDCAVPLAYPFSQDVKVVTWNGAR